jgi:hypothetical protein
MTAASTATAAASDHLSYSSSPSRSHFHPPTDPSTINRESLSCFDERTHLIYRTGKTLKFKCSTPVVWLIYLPNGTVLPACDCHFNKYFETHEIAADMVMRLSDDEDDFVAQGKGKINKPEQVDPICRVPRRMRKGRKK